MFGFLAATCTDGYKNQDESDVDCGGSTCSVRCAVGKACGRSADCTSAFCRPTDKTCQRM